MNAYPMAQPHPPVPAAGIELPEPGVFFDAARQIARTLCRDAIWHEEACNWTGWSIGTPDSMVQPCHRALEGTFYEGAAGIAFFLAHFHSIEPDPVVKDTIYGALEQSFRTAEKMAGNKFFGAYAGVTGIAYSALKAGELLNDPKLVSRAMEWLERSATTDVSNPEPDVMAGFAGSVPFLLSAGLSQNNGKLVTAAIQQAEQLMHTAKADAYGVSWDSVMPRDRNLLGYSHGVSGFAMALMEASAASQRQDFADMAAKAFSTERAFFNPQQSNWPDFRRMDGYGDPAQVQPHAHGKQHACMTAWCHGAVGIGYVRLRLLQLGQTDPSFTADLAAARAAALNQLAQLRAAPIADFGLCHGAFGTADFVYSLGKATGETALIDEARRTAADAVASHSRTGKKWPCGSNITGETPGLMLGIAGIGHFFLRLSERANVPSPLLIHPETYAQSPTSTA